MYNVIKQTRRKTSRLENWLGFYDVFTLPPYLKKKNVVVSKKLLNYQFLFILLAGQEDF